MEASAMSTTILFLLMCQAGTAHALSRAGAQVDTELEAIGRCAKSSDALCAALEHGHEHDRQTIPGPRKERCEAGRFLEVPLRLIVTGSRPGRRGCYHDSGNKTTVKEVTLIGGAD